MAKPITPIEDLREMAKQSMKHRMEVISLQVQADVCKKLEQIEGKSFRTDRWEREQGGGYIVCVLEDGKIFINFPVNPYRVAFLIEINGFRTPLLDLNLSYQEGFPQGSSVN